MSEVEIAKTNIGATSNQIEDLLGAFVKVEGVDPHASLPLVEDDPNGVNQHAPGAKLDSGKCDVGLLFESFPHALFAIAEVATFGAAKYTRGGWKEVAGGLLRYTAAEGRHMLYRNMGELMDKESGKLHYAHEAWNKLAQLEFVLTGREAQ